MFAPADEVLRPPSRRGEPATHADAVRGEELAGAGIENDPRHRHSAADKCDAGREFRHPRAEFIGPVERVDEPKGPGTERLLGGLLRNDGDRPDSAQDGTKRSIQRHVYRQLVGNGAPCHQPLLACTQQPRPIQRHNSAQDAALKSEKRHGNNDYSKDSGA